MYGLEGLSLILLFLFLVLSGSLAGGVERQSYDYRRQRRKIDREWLYLTEFAGPLSSSFDRTSQMQVALFRLAKRRGGKLTLSDVIIETGLGIHDAEALMNALVDNVYIRLEITENGGIVYEFPELMEQ